MSFQDKVVIVTGAAGGIGSATALHFAGLGAKLAIVDVNKDALKKIAEICSQKTKVLMITADLNKEEDVRNVIKQTVDSYQQVDVIINNAAISSKHNIFKEDFLEKYDETFNINLKAPMLLTHLAVPYLIATKGNIVNITSVGGIRPLPDLLMYNASKAALKHFTKPVALKVAPRGVRVNSIAPAAVRTEMVKLVGVTDVEEFNRRRAPQLPLQRMVECDELRSRSGGAAVMKLPN